MEGTAADYSKYFKSNSEAELESLQNLVDSMLTRVEEFGSILNVVKAEGQHCITEIIPQLESYRGDVNSITKRIDNLESFLGRVNSDLDVLEKQVEKAEDIFKGNSPDIKLKKLFKPLLGTRRLPTSDGLMETKDNNDPYATFKTSDYFYCDADDASS